MTQSWESVDTTLIGLYRIYQLGINIVLILSQLCEQVRVKVDTFLKQRRYKVETVL
jgi:hypothetical protein